MDSNFKVIDLRNYSFKLNIVTPSEQIFAGNVVQLTVRGTEGDIGVHHGHAPLLTSILPSMLTMVKKSGEKEYLYVAGGMMEIQPKGVNIMADVAIRAEDIDQQEAEKARVHAQEQLATCDLSDCLKIELELMQAVAKLRVIKNFQHLIPR